ncbi:hypothetical protein Pla163_04440 [Planctomycetes bacterium Pla163]|uniref:Outer membrane efflux protein n=1 Tax=Rohdeia mirabilis TaxID=2528008 RepID=A0A518CVV2_9BACT|nr:hypothetical protein Pla163_04440 [Planctomycetes bacterium Pla163]
MQPIADAPPRVRSAPRIAIALGACAATLLGTASCAAPTTESLDHSGALERLEARSDPFELERALERAALHRSPVTLPNDPLSVEPDDPAYWLVRALAWSPEVRASARTVSAAIADSKSAGAPQPIGFGLTDHEFGGDDERVELVATFDLLGLLGIGPARSERERAAAAVVVAAAELESEIWRSWLTVDAARLRFQAAAARERLLAEVLEQASADFDRIVILHERGWIGDAPAAAARAAVGSVERARSSVAADVAARRATLAHAAGVPPEDGAFEALLAPDRPASEPALRPNAELGDGALFEHPRLRELRTRFALREAEVRSVATSAWPNVGIGPHLGYEDDLAIGGVLQLTLPFPSSWRGRLAGAVERRDAVIEAYEDELHLLLVEERSARERRDEIHRRTTGATRLVVEGSTAGWSAARASFRVGRMPVLEWIDALYRRLGATTAEIDDAEALALAQVALAGARGPAGTRLPWQDERATEVTP